MKDIHKIKQILVKMKRGLHFREFKDIKKNSTDRTKLLNFFVENNIEYISVKGNGVYDCTLYLKTPIKKAFLILDNIEEDSYCSILKKYDFSSLLDKMKTNLLSPNECCEIIGCKRKDYRNIITCLSNKYPIYEEDDERVGLLV